MQRHRIKPNLHPMSLGVGGDRLIGGEQGQLRVPLASFIKRFDQIVPGCALTVVDLSEIQNLPLHDLTPSTPFALDDVPITVFLAVLEPSMVTKYAPSRL
jgi:hypothetical protein